MSLTSPSDIAGRSTRHLLNFLPRVVVALGSAIAFLELGVCKRDVFFLQILYDRVVALLERQSPVLLFRFLLILFPSCDVWVRDTRLAGRHILVRREDCVGLVAKLYRR